MRAVCPKGCETKTFLTTAHVSQTWKVDEDGHFLEEMSTDETVAEPSGWNIWTCTECGSEAEVTNE